MSSPIDMTTCPLQEVDTFDPEFLQKPHPFYRRPREEAPVYRDPKNDIIYVSTYAHVMEALAKPRMFSNGFARQLHAGASDGGGSAREHEISASGAQDRSSKRNTTWSRSATSAGGPRRTMSAAALQWRVSRTRQAKSDRCRPRNSSP